MFFMIESLFITYEMSIYSGISARGLCSVKYMCLKSEMFNYSSLDKKILMIKELM